MQCQKCKKEYPDEELMNGICFDCFENNQKEQSKLKNYKMSPIEEKHPYYQQNPIANYFKTWAVLVIIVGIFCSGYIFIHFENIILGIISFSSFAVTGSLLIAVAEIIQLLEDIKNK